MKKLTAQNLKLVLWETLHLLKTSKVQANEGDAIATQAREILRTTNVQLTICRQAKKDVPLEVVDFAVK